MNFAGESRVWPLGRVRWPGLEAYVVDASPGRFEAPPRADHRLMIHLGAPARVKCLYDDLGDARVQTRGDIDVVPAGYAAVWEDDDPTSTMSIWISPSLLAAAAQGMTRSDRRSIVEPKFQKRDPRIFQLALLLKEEVVAENPSDPLFIESLGLALATRLLDRCGLAERPAPGSTLSSPKLRLTLDYIEAHLGGDIRLADLADLVKVSPSHFRLLFRQTVRRPVHRYVIERRVRRAKALIEAGGVSIAEAALESGFCHQSHLARRMRQVLGRTPSEVARRQDLS
ncbi:MAG: helix-turn-helix transcriptional regulator [Caulobacteraceae bacterium]|nr:helix-turn-helix transcriptional regulator [Caulobacteraceae bacterium]